MSDKIADFHNGHTGNGRRHEKELQFDSVNFETLPQTLIHKIVQTIFFFFWLSSRQLITKLNY